MTVPTWDITAVVMSSKKFWVMNHSLDFSASGDMVATDDVFQYLVQRMTLTKLNATDTAYGYRIIPI